jgi:phage antirepressor YoqD-like protein
MENIKTFKYKESRNGNSIQATITFQTGDGIMINATEMAKPFKKNVAHWLRNDSTKAFIDAYSRLRNRNFADLVVIKSGNPSTGGGTWLHEDLAVEFARWLSPEFAIWCNARIKELLTIGITAAPDVVEQLIKNPDHAIRLFQELKDIQERNVKLKSKNIQQKEQLVITAPKAEYYDHVMSSKGTVTTSTVAANLDISAQALNVLLHDKGIQYRGSDCWLLYHPYHGKGYSKIVNSKTYTTGETVIRPWLRWTPRGEQFIYSLFPKKPMKRTTNKN